MTLAFNSDNMVYIIEANANTSLDPNDEVIRSAAAAGYTHKICIYFISIAAPDQAN